MLGCRKEFLQNLEENWIIFWGKMKQNVSKLNRIIPLKLFFGEGFFTILPNGIRKRILMWI